MNFPRPRSLSGLVLLGLAIIALPPVANVQPGKWMTIGWGLRCFSLSQQDASHISTPFSVTASGAAEFSIAKVQLGTVTEHLNRHWYERNTGQVVTEVQREGLSLHDGEQEHAHGSFRPIRNTAEAGSKSFSVDAATNAKPATGASTCQIVSRWWWSCDGAMKCCGRTMQAARFSPAILDSLELFPFGILFL